MRMHATAASLKASSHIWVWRPLYLPCIFFALLWVHMADQSSPIQRAALQAWSEASAALPAAGKHLEDSFGVPAEVVLPAIVVLLLMGCALLCCCLRRKGEGRDPLLPKHVSRSDLIQSTPQEEAKSVTVVVAEQEGGRGGGWGDLDGFDPSITINRQEHPTSRRGADLSKYYDSEAPPVARRGGGSPANKLGAAAHAMARGWGSGRKG